jgi:PKD repeat protein
LTIFPFGCGEDVAKILTPIIASISPSSANVGSQNVAGTITGSNFNGVTAVNMGSGVTVHNFVGVNPSQIDITFSIDNDASPGPRTVSITSANGVGSSSSHFNVVNDNKPPVASFAVKPGKTGDTNTEFAFDASNSDDPDGKISEYSWDFGDGKKAKGKEVSHQFDDAKKYTVKLTVTDSKGLKDTAQKELAIEKATRIKCAGIRGKGKDYLFDVVSADKSKRVIIGKFYDEKAGCKAFYLCGDIRVGGWPGNSPGDEKWIGIMCEYYWLGDGLAEIHTYGGKYWPTEGQKRLYTHAQLDCNPKDCNKR